MRDGIRWTGVALCMPSGLLQIPYVIMFLCKKCLKNITEVVRCKRWNLSHHFAGSLSSQRKKIFILMVCVLATYLRDLGLIQGREEAHLFILLYGYTWENLEKMNYENPGCHNNLFFFFFRIFIIRKCLGIQLISRALVLNWMILGMYLWLNLTTIQCILSDTLLNIKVSTRTCVCHHSERDADEWGATATLPASAARPQHVGAAWLHRLPPLPRGRSARPIGKAPHSSSPG